VKKDEKPENVAVPAPSAEQDEKDSGQKAVMKEGRRGW